MTAADTDRAIIIVHSLDHAVAAARAGATAGRPVLLRSARGAAAYAGIGWFAALIAATRAGVPDADIRGALDCADDLALAFEAAAAGIDAIRYDGGAAGLAKLRDVTGRSGVTLDEAPGRALDLARAGGLDEALRDFLG